MRVYEYAKQRGCSSREILDALAARGVVLSNHMAVLSEESIALLQAPAEKSAEKPKKSTAEVPAVKPLQSKAAEPAVSAPVAAVQPVVAPVKVDAPVIARTMPIMGGAPEIIDSGEAAAAPAKRKKGVPVKTPVANQRIFSRETVVTPSTVATLELSVPLTVLQLSEAIAKSVTEVVFVLLKQGVVRTVNERLTVAEARACAEFFGVVVEVPQKAPVHRHEIGPREDTIGADRRLPIVVVMGHVDHGKTTLLDYLRKTNVASREKGGITQHLGAYEVKTGKGSSVIFLDTPGHEAFSYMRQRGTHVTDIAIIIVAVNDGVKPQTVEAITLAKQAGVPIVVAINKIDKPGVSAQLDTIKTQLAQHGLTPEEWGGETVCVPISAKTGQGIDQLLEILALHAEMLDLKTRIGGPARAFMLEVQQVRGHGAAATVICREGTLKRGDYFVCGTATGRVRILTDSSGKQIESVGPSVPVQVSGFDSVEGLGDWFTVVSAEEYNAARNQPKSSSSTLSSAQHNGSGRGSDAPVLRFLFKGDTQGSCQALKGAMERLSRQKEYQSVVLEVVASEVGAITEGDVQRAYDSKAFLFGLHVRPERNAHVLAKQYGVEIVLHSIIYHLIEEIEGLIQRERDKIVRLVPVGTAEVLKVFPIKNHQVIAGSIIKEGILSLGDKVVCVRRKKEIGHGIVTSLQRDRREAKEIREGYDCGFLTDTFHDWQTGDIVRIFAHQKGDE